MLAQQVVATPPDALATHLVQFAVGIILALNVWMVRSVVQTNDAIRVISEWAFGRKDSKTDGGVDDTVTALGKIITGRTLQLQEITNTLHEHHKELELASARAHWLDSAITPIYVHLEMPLPDRRQFNRRHDDP